MKLKAIFDAITPENIKDIPLIKAAMEIFIANLEENSQIAIDIKNIYNNISKETDSAILKRTKDELRSNLLDVYLGSLYKILSQAQSNIPLKQKLESQQLSDIPFISDITKILNDEYFVTNKSFKEKIGTKTGVTYAYNLTKYLESSENINDMKLTEIKPFHFKTDGSIFKEMYENIVKPMAHPLGFTYSYSQIIKESLTDLFGGAITYTVNAIEVRSLDGYIDVFTPDTNSVNVRQDFLLRTNPLTGDLYTDAEYNKYITVHTSKVVDTFIDTVIDKRVFKSFIFTDGTYLEQYTNPIEIRYMLYTDFLAGNNTFIKQFTGHRSLYVDYTSSFKFDYYDEITQFITQLNITKIKENNNGNEAQQYFNFTSGVYAFHVGGDSYEYAPGLDESTTVYNDSDAINNEIANKFNVTISGKTILTNTLLSIKLSDSHKHVLSNIYVQSDGNGNFSAVFNTYGLSGDAYTIEAVSSDLVNTYTYKMSTTGLNNFNRALEFTDVQDWNHISSNTLRISGKGPVGKTIQLVLTDSDGHTVTAAPVVGVGGDWQAIVSLALKTAGNFRIDATIYDNLGKVTNHSFFEGSDLRTYKDDVKIKVQPFVYTNGAPNYAALLGSTNLASTNDMHGINSTSSLILKQIGELAINDTYAQPDSNLLEYMLANGYTDFNQLPSTVILSGAYVEGSDYSKVTFDLLTEEETFINYGRKVYPIGSSDVIVVTSEDYCKEDILIFPYSSEGYYLYTDENSTEDYYLYTTDSFYLNTLGG